MREKTAEEFVNFLYQRAINLQPVSEMNMKFLLIDLTLKYIIYMKLVRRIKN